MGIAHTVAIRVFCGQEENENEIVNGLKSLLPFDLEKEKILIRRQNALGFNDRKIVIFEAVLNKNRHVKAFLENILEKVSGPDKQMLLRQLDSRVDDDANFFVRFEKETLAKHNELLVTDNGNCYHVKIKMAAYPSSKQAAIAVMKEVLEKA
ncbi:hypothetical protein HYY73_00765 [Candidatus Woesearchaeota archaeon]|nr:hypothetical protein [Candidatus Woesearchaeota archaeon]